MRRLSLPSSMTIYVAIWPFPCTSFHSSVALDPQTWQVCCGGYWNLVQTVQCCKTSRFWFTASQKGWLKASGTGITFGIVSLHVQGCLWYGHCHGAGIPWKALAVHRARTLGSASERPGATKNSVTLGEGIPIVMDMGV